MYSDEDGLATKRSQAAYDAHMGTLLRVTSTLSLLGFGFAILNGEYAAGIFTFPLSTKQPGLSGLSAIIWPVILSHSLTLHWKEDPVHIYAAGLRGSLLSILIVSSKFFARDPNIEEPLFGLSMASVQLYAAGLLAIIQILYPRRPDLFTPGGKLVDLERSSSAFSRYSMQWCTSALALAGKAVALDELPVLDYSTRSTSQPPISAAPFEAILWDRIFIARYRGFVKQWILMFARSMVTFGSPYCAMRLLKSFEDNHSRSDDAWIWLIGIGISSISQIIINYHLIWIQWSEMGIPIRAQLIMAIFQKALRIKDSKSHQEKGTSTTKAVSDKPEAVNLISSDTLALSKFTAVSYIIPSSFVRFFFAVLFLLRLLGWQSTLIGIIVTALCIPIHGFVIKQQRAAHRDLTAARDRKTRAITEALHSLRQIKFSALETQWEEHIKSFRQEEIKHLRRSFTASNIRSVWKVAAPFIAASASICAYTRFHKTITPSVIFPLIEVLPNLQESLGVVPLVIQDYISARLHASRIDDFLRRPEQKRILDPSLSGRVSFRDASISWPLSEEVEKTKVSREKQSAITPSHYRFSLDRINLEFPIGELSVISGKTGSGKSLLLAAIIGEVDLLSGRIQAPSVADNHPVAYVSQNLWLQNATFKDNILFGSPLDKQRYKDILSACALQSDLAALAEGDATQIGLRGVKLSGGQRTRLTLGKALYSSAQLLVLDDIFSSLDSQVSRHIFDALTGELGHGRTRILATHNVSLCLPKTQYIVYLSDRTVAYAATMEKVVSLVEPELHYKTQPPTEDKSDGGVRDKPAKERPVTAKRVEKLYARTDVEVYKSYFSAAGGARFMSIFLIGLVTKQLLSALTTWLLGRINSARRQEETVNTPEKTLALFEDGLGQYFYLYFGSSLLAITVEFLFNLHTFSGSVRASKVLFQEVAFRILRMPILWLDTIPIGELLKAFTVDTKTLDDLVLDALSEFVVYIQIYELLTVALLFWCAQVSTRAFGAVDKSIGEMHRHLDSLSTARRHFWIFNRWLGLQMSLIGVLFSTGTGIILLLSKSVVHTSLLGFSLTFSLGFSRAIFKAVNSFGHLETAMDAAGAVIGYTELDMEEQGGIEVLEDWPSRGEVEVKELDIAYSANLPLVLNDISFTIQAGQRTGIVGRTGAGKSSLALSLIRLIEPRRGSVLIDGIDISTVKLRDLRTRVAFIPQDPVLFSGTVRSNLDYFRQVPEGRLLRVLRRVKLLADDGDEKSGLFTLDSAISTGGSNMSQGQRQLLCLARVLLKKPTIMILDEATSAVDNKTDLLIQDTISKEFTGTLIVIAHRLRTIAGFDQVMVISGGRVVENGRPDELLRNKGMFYDLVQDSHDSEFFH